MGRPAPLPAGLPLLGQTLGGKYEIVRLLGEGGMAFVFEAVHKRLEQRVAIKVLSPELASDVELVARFQREARALARLRSKHVVRVTDVEGTSGRLPYIVMEFLEGRDLEVELRTRKRLPVAESVDLVLQACSAMVEAHAAGIVHRDLKPGNLFLVSGLEGAPPLVKVIDFGVSKVAGEATRLTTRGEAMGTILYMAPEQVRGDPDVDLRVDIWALGAILFELLSGRTPYEGNAPQIAVKIVSSDAPDLGTLTSLPPALALVVRRMMERDLAKRYATIVEVIAALAPFAPLGSVGAAVVERLATGATGSRGRTVPLSAKRTLPMPGAKGLAAKWTLRMASSKAHAAASAAPGPPPEVRGPVASKAVPAPTAGAGSRRWVLMVLLIASLLFAVGAVILIASRRAKLVGRADATSEATATVSAGSAEPAAPAASTAREALPPPTGTSGDDTTAPSATSRRSPRPGPARRDGGTAAAPGGDR